MNYSTFHGANSVNTFNMLLDDYVAGQLNDFDEEIATIFTKKRQIEKNEVSLVYPNEIFNYDIDEGHKIAIMDIHSYDNLMNYYRRECMDEVAFNSRISERLEFTYIDIASKNILTIETTMGNVLEQIFNILSIKTEGILFGIILNVNGKNFNLTHPSVLQLFLDEYDWLMKSHRKCTLYIYINEDKEDCKILRDFNEKSYGNPEERLIDKENYKEILKKNILFSCALAKSKITSPQKVTIDSFSLVDYSSHDIYLTSARHSLYSSVPNILELNIEGYLPRSLNFPEEGNFIDIPYYIPIDILAKGVFVPYYGGVVLKAKLNISTGICKTEYNAMQISPFRSGNIYPSHEEFTRVCTGNLKEYDLNTICSINYLNANSAYHHNTIATGFLDAIELNIEIAHSILADYLKKDTNESKDNNNENNDNNKSSNESSSENTSSRTQEGSDTDSQSASNRDISMETEMAQSNNPFERDISYQQRISSSHVESSVS